VFLALKSVDGLDYEYRDSKNCTALMMNRSGTQAADSPGRAG
jgi:hypothetical protein